MRSFLDKFIKITDDDNDEVIESEAPVATPVAPSVNPATPPPPAAPSYTIPVSQVANSTQMYSSANSAIPQYDMEKVKSLYQDLIDCKDVRSEYLELKNHSEALVNMGMTDKQRFEATLRIIQVQNPKFTKEGVLNSVDAYIFKLNEINKLASAQCDGKRDGIRNDMAKETAARNVELASLNSKNEALRKEIEVNEQRMAELQSLNDNAESKCAEAIAALDQEYNVFCASIKYVSDSLTADRNTIVSLS